MTQRIVVKACLLAVALSAVACGVDTGEDLSAPELADLQTSSQGARSTNKVLLLGSSVNGGRNSREAQAVSAASPYTQIDVATPEQWRAMTAAQFMTYRAIIIGDAACQSGTAAFQAAVDTRNNWGAVVDGNVVLLSTDPTSNRTQRLVENAIRFVLDSAQYRTGMYVALGCAYQDAHPNTTVTLLEPFGTFKVQGVPGCAESAHMIRTENTLLSQSISDSMLSGNGCAARSVFTTYPERNFSFAALALSTRRPVPGQRSYQDFLMHEGRAVSFLGTPYVLAYGTTPQAAGCGLSDHRTELEECDMGEGLNGQAVDPEQPASENCSFSCKLNWCGDGVVDRAFGEECDLGINNGRTHDASGNIGACTAFCQRPRASRPPEGEACVDVRLGDYNLFLLEDYTGGHDVVGKVAAGGNITMTNFAVGSGLPDTQISNTLVAGGHLTLSRGAVWGHTFHAGSYSTDSSVIYPRGNVARGRPIDFAARFAELRRLSSRLAGLRVNGSSDHTTWGGIMLRGTSTNVNVFDVNANAFNGAKLLSIDAPAGSLVVVNIRGASARFSGFGIHFSGGIDQHGVLYNFVDATQITAQGFGFWGTVLAPSAHVTFNDGSWDGGLYAKSLTGNAEGHINPLHDRRLCP